MGRTRKSYQEHELSGTNKFNPQRQKWNKRNDRPLTEKPAPDRYLQRTKSAWHQFMEVKAGQKVLSVEDEKSVILMFDSLDRYFRMSDEVDRIYRLPNFSEWLCDEKNMKQFCNMKNELRKDNDAYRTWAIRFGLTPTERSKLPSIEEDEKESPLMKFVKLAKEA